MANVVLLTDRGEWHQARILAAAPAPLRVTVLRNPPPEVLWPALAKAEYIISERNQPVTASMMAAAPHLRMIVRFGSIYHEIDMAAAQSAGIVVIVQPIQGVIFCAEHAMLMILSLVRRLNHLVATALEANHGKPAARTDENTFSYNWMSYTNLSGIHGKTVAILGMGEIGVELARRLRCFSAKAVLYHKRKPYPLHLEMSLGVKSASFEQCLSQSDVVVSLLPYSTDTDYRTGTSGITKEAVAQMKQGTFFVHLGSGSVVDEMAIIAALQAGKLGGAAFDTYEYEPLQSDNPLIALAKDPNANLLLLPHVGSASSPPNRSGDYAPIMADLASRT
jgi:phosphoglycerate dehydrogenase-like enzyme